ncbi:hypothetical protein pb186bvf_020468 [Paramecium bursaria]
MIKIPTNVEEELMQNHINFVIYKFQQKWDANLNYQNIQHQESLSEYQPDPSLFPFKTVGFDLRASSNLLKLNFFQKCVLEPLVKYQGILLSLIIKEGKINHELLESSLIMNSVRLNCMYFGKREIKFLLLLLIIFVVIVNTDMIAFFTEYPYEITNTLSLQFLLFLKTFLMMTIILCRIIYELKVRRDVFFIQHVCSLGIIVSEIILFSHSVSYEWIIAGGDLLLTIIWSVFKLEFYWDQNTNLQ